ncbi:hypothetical protein WG68_12675 [Arsukibacterium ikkense]|uniref:DUF1240 domain-containing protein n=1 Tax=Arsukibacterium ikkense TaxID=336831 RepID=A0A0M2V5Q9_9GAMM|nr:hypothetical protein [Arsukibacterium ikkense]KKO44990.1 hypothetical protein WG68_12675 [Arsukibacterium ikkense]
MTINSRTAKPLTFSGLVSTGLILLFILTVSIYGSFELFLIIRQLVNIEDRPLYIMGSHNVMALVFGIPGLLLVAVSHILKDLNKLTAERLNLGFKIIGFLLVAMIATRIIYGGFFLDGYLEKYGYSYCGPMTAPKAMAMEVWVSDPGYCLEDSRNVSSEVRDWLDAKRAAGERPTAAEAEQKIKQLAQANQARFNRF